MRSFVRSALVGSVVWGMVGSAFAAQTEEDEMRSSASAALKWESRESIKGPKSNSLGGGMVQIFVSADLDPPKDPAKPLLSVDMPKGVTLQASWTDEKGIDLKTVDAQNKEGVFSVNHTLAPHVKLALTFGNTSGVVDYNAEKLLDSIHGSNFVYLGTGKSEFVPWGWSTTSLQVQGPPLTQSRLAAIRLRELADVDEIDLTLSLNATTSPQFNYVTKEVRLGGVPDPIAAQGGVRRIPTVDTDFIDVSALVTGEISYTGTIDVNPVVHIENVRLFGSFIPLKIDLPVTNVQASLPYSSGSTPIAVTFPAVVFHIPLPNVKVTMNTLDLGSTTIGKEAARAVEIKNTGEKDAALTFKSSDPQFTVISAKTVTGPKSKYDLNVKFVPTAAGPQSATITVVSNDPNEPQQQIKVTGTGLELPKPPAAQVIETNEPLAEPSSDSGCGCRTASTSSSDTAGGALMALFAASLIRRRRSR